MEQFSQKTNCKLAEDFIYNQSYKKRSLRNCIGWKKKGIRMKLVPLGGMVKEERSTKAGPHPGAPPVCREVHWDRERGWGGPGLCS